MFVTQWKDVSDPIKYIHIVKIYIEWRLFDYFFIKLVIFSLFIL